MADEQPVFFKYPKPAMDMKYVHACKDRYFPGDAERQIPWCLKISEAVGASVGTTQVMCARCQLSGNVSESFVTDTALGILMTYLDYAVLGFYPSEEEIVAVMKNVLKNVNVDPERFIPKYKPHIESLFLKLVEHGRITEATAINLCSDVPWLS